MTLLSYVTVAVALEFFLCKTKLVDFPVLERLTQYNFKGSFGKLKPVDSGCFHLSTIVLDSSIGIEFIVEIERFGFHCECGAFECYKGLG
jgi:hypothetical protein